MRRTACKTILRLSALHHYSSARSAIALRVTGYARSGEQASKPYREHG